MKGKWLYVTMIAATIILVIMWLVTPSEAILKRAATWKNVARPGSLSAAHAFLEHNCAACHTSVEGADAIKCIACHANNEALLQRQPTAFHASIGSCRECHLEHRGREYRATIMDHQALAKIGLRHRNDDEAGSENSPLREQFVVWTSELSPPHERITSAESNLNCATCHANEDRHRTLFGQDCAQCHATEQWTIPEFRHPSPSSTDCAQCHQAPPSHYMEHFRMVSMRVAGKPHANVSQCFLCHQTTAWNDIQSVGWYKHH